MCQNVVQLRGMGRLVALWLCAVGGSWSVHHAQGLVVPQGLPDIWGGSARGTVVGGPSGFIFAFSGADGPTKEGSGFCGLHAKSNVLGFDYSIDFIGGLASLGLRGNSSGTDGTVVLAAVSDVVALGSTTSGSIAETVLAYTQWDLLVGYTANPGDVKLVLGGITEDDLSNGAAHSMCNITGRWHKGSENLDGDYIFNEDGTGSFSGIATSPRSWKSALGAVASNGTITIAFDTTPTPFHDIGRFSSDCSCITWTRNPGIWTRDGPPTPPPPPSPLPPGVACKTAGLMALCTSGRLFSVAYGVDATTTAASSVSTLTLNIVDSVASSRLAPLIDLPAPLMNGTGYERLARKMYSIMRANTLAPEGIEPGHWSTPDKTPHKAMWLWDSCFHAIGRAVIEPELAWEFLVAMLRAAAPDGHVPIQAEPWNGLLSGDTQPPLLALATSFVREAGGVNDSALAWALPKLERYIEWDFQNRDKNDDGLLEWDKGTESGLDNSPLWDKSDSNTMASTDFSVYVALECSLIANMHKELGNASAATLWSSRANRTAAMIHSQLWDSQDGFYYYKHLGNNNQSLGPFERVMTPSGFAPLLLDGVPDDRVAQILKYLKNSTRFSLPQPLPTVTPGSTFSTNMWRGPAWTNTNFFTILGLRKYGHVPGALVAADALQKATVEMVRKGYEQFGVSFEFYDSTGKVPPTQLERKSSPNSGGVRDYHWTAANTFWLLHNPQGTLPGKQSSAKRTPAKPYEITDKVYDSVNGADAVRSKIFKNPETGESAEVLWNWGGKVERVALRKGPGHPVRDVLASRCDVQQTDCSAEDMMGNSSLGALLIPFANRIADGLYTFNGQVYQLSPTNQTVRHGFLIEGRPLRVLSMSATDQAATVVLGVTFNGSDPGYPFVVEVNVTYTLDAFGFSVTIGAKNLMSHDPAPFMAGCHPYFKLQHSTLDTATLILDRRCTQWNRQFQTAGQVPNGSTTFFHGFNGTDTVNAVHRYCPACQNTSIWDDGFTALSSVHDCEELRTQVHDGPDTLALTLDSSFRYVQVFSGIPSAGLAVEPMSSATNAFNNEDGIIVLEAGQSWVGGFAFGLESV